MKFTSDDLRRLTAALPLSMSKAAARLSVTFRRRQPDFCQMIGEVGLDPRCVRAHAFCVAFCAVALAYAEHRTGRRFPKWSAARIREVTCLIAQRQSALIGRRASRYPTRIRRYVLKAADFDEDDTRWLCTTLSAFLVMLEGSSGQRRQRPQARRHSGQRARSGPIPASHPKSWP